MHGSIRICKSTTAALRQQCASLCLSQPRGWAHFGHDIKHLLLYLASDTRADNVYEHGGRRSRLVSRLQGKTLAVLTILQSAYYVFHRWHTLAVLKHSE